MTGPAKVLPGAQVGNICSGCNKGIQTGDLVRPYATRFEYDGWVVRRLWLTAVGSQRLDEEQMADEAIIRAVFWKHRLAAVVVND